MEKCKGKYEKSRRVSVYSPVLFSCLGQIIETCCTSELVFNFVLLYLTFILTILPLALYFNFIGWKGAGKKKENDERRRALYTKVLNFILFILFYNALSNKTLFQLSWKSNFLFNLTTFLFHFTKTFSFNWISLCHYNIQKYFLKFFLFVLLLFYLKIKKNIPKFEKFPLFILLIFKIFFYQVIMKEKKKKRSAFQLLNKLKVWGVYQAGWSLQNTELIQVGLRLFTRTSNSRLEFIESSSRTVSTTHVIL